MAFAGGRSDRVEIDDHFSARLLCDSEATGGQALRRAFALVRLCEPGADARRWAALVRHYRRRAPGRAGLMMLEDARGYAHAVFCYAVDDAPRLHGLGAPSPQKVLRVRDVVAAHLGGPRVETALRSCATHLAGRLGCASVAFDAPAGP